MNETIIAIDVGSKGIKFVFWHPESSEIEIIDALVFLEEEIPMVLDTLKDCIRKWDISTSADKVYISARDGERDILNVLHALFKRILASVSKRFGVIDIKKFPLQDIMVTITVPAQELIRAQTTKIFEEAALKYGFNPDNVKFLPEPEAAAQAWEWLPYFPFQYLWIDKNLHNHQLDDEIVVVDCGGGTLDWAFLRRNKESGTDFECVRVDHNPRTKDMIDGSIKTEVTEEHIETVISDLKKYIDEIEKKIEKKPQILLVGGNYDSSVLKEMFKKDKYRIVSSDSPRAALLATVIGGFLYKNAAAYYALGQKNMKEAPRIAVAAFQKALSIDPTYEDASFSLVAAAIEADVPDVAEKVLPIEISPLDKDILNYKCLNQMVTKLSHRKPDEAVAYVELARKINPAHSNSDTQLRIAIQYNASDIIKILLAGGANPNTIDERNWTPLHYAVKVKVPKIIKILLAGGANPNSVNQDGLTPLHCAILWDAASDIVRVLLEGGADPNAGDVMMGVTPLHCAILWDAASDIVRMLLEGGADPNARDQGDRTPLHCAFMFDTASDIVRMLLEGGADPNARCRSGMKPQDYKMPGIVKTIYNILRNKSF